MFFVKLGLLLALSVNCQAETLSQLITGARVLSFDASSGSRQRFSDSQITVFLNQAQRQAISATHCLTNSFSFSLQPGVTFYAMPTNYLTIQRVTRGKLALQELTPAGLDGRSRGWEQTTGTPVYYFVNFSSRGLLGFAPFPATSTDTDTIKVDFYIDATDLANSTDVPFNGVNEMSSFQHGLQYYAAGMMMSISGSSTLAKTYFDNFSNVLAVMKSRCMDRSNYLPSAVASP